MEFSEIGEKANKFWLEIPEHFLDYIINNPENWHNDKFNKD